MSLRIAVWAPAAREPILGALSSFGGLEIVEATSARQFIAALEGAKAAVVPGLPQFYTQEVAAAVAASPTLAWVHISSAGYEGLWGAPWPGGVRFTHPGGAASGAVGEHAFAMLLALARRLDKAAVAQTRETWDRSFAKQATTLSGATLAVVGYGSIGQRVARLASGYDMTVLGVSRSGRPSAGAHEVHPASDLLEVLPRADAVVCALPMSPQTRHLFDAQAFARFKPTAFFINIGRGGVVDQAALIQALSEGRLAGAGLDVTDPEPLPDGDPLWSAPNILITSHYAGGGDRGAGRRIADGLLENVRRFMADEPLAHPISPP